ncbi:MAG: tol-pal system protein YbgF, partial [Pigmentiphaga sp.]|nr:tol-pal system protein YbgF [Pigmentiphaga sp.]
MTHRTFVLRSLLASSLVGLGLLSSPAHALFSDDEARKAILELRKEVRDQSDNHSERLMQSQRVQLQLSQQIDQLQQEVARLRGQIEVLTKQVADTKQAQRDIFLDVDARLKRFEPQTTSIDGEEVTVAPDEKRDFDAAIERFRNGSYDQALQALQTFAKAF